MPLIFMKSAGRTHALMVNSGAVIDVAEIPNIAIAKPSAEMLDKLTVKDLMGVMEELGLRGVPRNAKKPQIIDAFLRAWDGVIMREASASSTTSQQEQTQREACRAMVEHMEVNPPTVVEMDSSGNLVGYGALGSEKSVPEAPQEPEPEEVMPETWTEHDDATLNFLTSLMKKGMNLNPDERLMLEEKKKKATNPEFLLLKDLNGINLNDETETKNMKVSIVVETLNGKIIMGYYYDKMTRVKELKEEFMERFKLSMDDITLKVGDAILEPFDTMESYVQDKGFISMYPKLRGGGVQKKLKDARKLIENSKGSEQYAPICASMMSMVVYALDKCDANPRAVMEEIVKSNSEADLASAVEILSRVGGSSEQKVKQIAPYLFGQNGTAFFGLHGKVESISDGAKNALFHIFGKCDYKNVSEFKDYITTCRDIKIGENSVLARQALVFKKNLPKYGIIPTQVWNYTYPSMELYLPKYGIIPTQVWNYTYPSMELYLPKYGIIPPCQAVPRQDAGNGTGATGDVAM